jgi:small subunit ribosomal protein S2
LQISAKDIIEAGVHFGHRASRWHPKMAPFIFGRRNLIHIIDVRHTLRGLVRASNFLTQLAATGKEVVFIGTKRQAKTLVMEEAQRSGMHWVSERWLGGTLTNYHTVRGRLRRLEELEGYEADGSIEHYSKKRISALRRERRKILRNLEGLRRLRQIPGALVVVDIRREHNSVLEAKKVGVPVVALVDTDCDPRSVDIAIPGNDDAYRSIQIVLRCLSDAILLGRKRYETQQAETRRAEQEAQKSREEERARASEQAAARERAAQAAQAVQAAAAAQTAQPVPVPTSASDAGASAQATGSGSPAPTA